MTEARPRRPMKPRSEWKERKTLWQHGRRGAANRVRVLVDAAQDRVEVHYKDGRGVRQKEIFRPDSRDSRNAAIAFAEAFVEELAKLGGAKAETTHAELWKAYTESPAWKKGLRKTSHRSYTERWKRWVKWRGATTKPDDTTLHHIDRFTVAMQEGERPVAMNQIRETLNVVRTVYRWGRSRKLVTENVFADFRWTTPKAEGGEDAESDAEAEASELGPPEYSPEEYHAILAELPPQSSRTWRAHVMFLFAGTHGQRARALLHLRWADIRGGAIHWPARYQKNGKVLVQPLTWDAVAAFETARDHRARLGYEGPWVLPGGSRKRRGIAPGELREWEKDPKHKKVGTGTGKPREVADAPYHYQSAYSMLRAAEDRAGVQHQEGRAFHGMRKMSAGNVFDATGDAGLALEWVGDDIRQANRYLKRRTSRLARAADAIETKTPTKEDR